MLYWTGGSEWDRARYVLERPVLVERRGSATGANLGVV